ncbi:phospholipase B-like [Physella acuta]|uniref:phospholipase B-like n=1 Tax=Physella acuta TaxID=109671 RepID=UPI0027DB4ECC|nr:phospholipase B-like [Physella acuta]
MKGMNYSILLTFCFLFYFRRTIGGSLKNGSVYCKERSMCYFMPDVLDIEKATSFGTFDDSLLTTGWSILDISAGNAPSEEHSNDDIMYAAGFLEGALTARQMENHFANTFEVFFPNPVDEKLKEKLNQWFLKQREWADYMIKTNSNDPLWRHAGYIFSQLDGLYDGYKAVSGKNPPLDKFALNFLNANGDFFDLRNVLNPSSIPNWRQFSPEEASDYFYNSGHCSVLIKILPGIENIFMSHSSWFVYAATNRIYKHYNFNVSDSYTASKRVSFSSYPGYLESLDDFYHLGSGMVMLQTTINVFNSSLYQYVSPQSLLAWQRVRIANMMAKSGKQWGDIFAKYNSGTYNNQYMVIDLKLFTPKKPILDNTLWVVEQIPGLVVAEDATPILRAGYFPSYNIPFFEEIYDTSGYPDYVDKHGLDYSYDLAPRAKIFRRDQGKVNDLNSMKDIMRENDYKNDPYSGGLPTGAICARGDLDKKNPRASGCYDTKVSDYSMAMRLQADIINGPTLGNDLPAFSWSGIFANQSHIGLPDIYNFSFVRTKPRF